MDSNGIKRTVVSIDPATVEKIKILMKYYNFQNASKFINFLVFECEQRVSQEKDLEKKLSDMNIDLL